MFIPYINGINGNEDITFYGGIRESVLFNIRVERNNYYEVHAFPKKISSVNQKLYESLAQPCVPYILKDLLSLFFPMAEQQIYDPNFQCL